MRCDSNKSLKCLRINPNFLKRSKTRSSKCAPRTRVSNLKNSMKNLCVQSFRRFVTILQALKRQQFRMFYGKPN